MNIFNEPTVTFCEKISSDIISRPGYAFSNIAYIIVGLTLLLKYPKSKVVKAFGFISLLIGTLSFVYDAKPVYLTQIFDLTGMLVFTGLLLVLNLEKLTKFKAKYLTKYIASLILIGDLLIIYFKGYAGNVVFGLFVLTAIVTEILLYKKGVRKYFKYWIFGLTLFLIGFVIWLFDVSKTICSPVTILNGRAIFHYLTSITIYLLAIYYFKNEKGLT